VFHRLALDEPRDCTVTVNDFLTADVNSDGGGPPHDSNRDFAQ
jgi:hypothetical protein